MRCSALVLSLLTLGACGGDDGGSEYPETYDCEQETTDDEFLIGMEKMGQEGVLSFKLVDFVPAPPSRLLNAWTLELSTAADSSPMPGATLDVFPFMPAHGHGAGVEVEVTPMGAAGSYQLDDINLHMPGMWEVTITAETPAGDDVVIFRPCIPK